MLRQYKKTPKWVKNLAKLCKNKNKIPISLVISYTYICAILDFK